MLQTQFLGADASGFYGVGQLGTIQSTAGTAALQNYMKSIGKISQSNVTGVMNDATMAQIFNMLIESAGTVGKIPLLPADVRNGITTVVNALKSADSKIRSISFGQAGLSTVISNWVNINAAVRLAGNAISSGAGDSAANAMAAARDAVYNAVASQASIIEKAIRIFFPPAQPATGTVTTGVKNIATLMPGLFQIQAQALSPGGGAAAPSAAVPAGSIFARSSKFPGKFRVAIPKFVAGLGGIGLMDDGVFGDCIFGDCGLGATAAFTEIAPVTSPPAGGREVTEKDLEAQTGQTPFFKKPLFWVAVAGGVVVIGGGSYFLIRRRKRSA